MLRDSKKLLIVAVAIAIVSSGCFKSKNVVTKIGSPSRRPPRLDGVPYALPRTVIQARVPFKRQDKTPGEFEKFAPCFFPRDVAAQRIRANAKVFSVGIPTLGSRGEPDPNERYMARIKGGFFENKTLFLEFNPDGVITKGEASSTNVAIDVAIGAVKTAISVAAKAATPGTADAAAPTDAAGKRAELISQVQICRATIVAEAASDAANAALDVVKAAGNPTEPNAQNAKVEARNIEQRLAAEERDLTDLAAAVNISAVMTRGSSLVAEVVSAAEAVRASVMRAAGAAASAGADPAAAIDAANQITKAIESIEVVDPDPKAFTNTYVRAREKVWRLRELKKNREDLTSGVSFSQGLTADALQKMIDDLDKTISSYQDTFFMGTVQEDNWTADFEFRPGRIRVATNSRIVPTSYNTTQTSPVLIWFSKSKGLCASNETTAQGIQIKSTFKSDTCPANDARALWMGVERQQTEEHFLHQIATTNERDERRGERGFYYRVPAQSLVKITLSELTEQNAQTLDTNSANGQNWIPTMPPPANSLLIPTGRELGRNRIKIAQLGVIASLPASAAGRTTQYTIDFDETTGALKNFKLASNALLEKSLVEEAGAAATDVITAQQAREKARKEANDELNKKKRELELLQTENQINEERKKLEAAQPAPTPQPR